MTRCSLVTLALLLSCATATAGTLTLSPAVVPLGGKSGQSTQQHLTVFNGTDTTLSFKLVAKDVLVRDGARAFVNAGDISRSVAATARFSVASVTVPPGEDRAVDVTLTLPAGMNQRAVVVVFEGTTKLGGGATVSIGSLLTFDLATRSSLDVGGAQASPPTASANAAVAVPVHNDGGEPLIARAAAAIVRADGAMVGRLPLDSRRLLPGEKSVLRADYPGDLPAGTYRVLVTVENGRTSWTRSADLVVP